MLTDETLCYYKVPGDNDCGFHCLSLFLRFKKKKLSRNEEDNVKFLRSQLIEYYKKPPKSSPISKKEIAERLYSLQQSSDEWMTDTDLRVFSSIYRLKFKIKIQGGGFQCIDYQSFLIDKRSFQQINKDTCILFYRGNHYDLILPYKFHQVNILEDYTIKSINNDLCHFQMVNCI